MSKYADLIINAVENIAEQKINDANFVQSHIGQVVNVSGFDATVNIRGGEFEVRIFEHLLGNIHIGDIVLINELPHAIFSMVIVSRITSGG